MGSAELVDLAIATALAASEEVEPAVVVVDRPIEEAALLHSLALVTSPTNLSEKEPGEPEASAT